MIKCLVQNRVFEVPKRHPNKGSRYEYLLNDKKSIGGIDKKHNDIERININLSLKEGYFAVAKKRKLNLTIP